MTTQEIHLPLLVHLARVESQWIRREGYHLKWNYNWSYGVCVTAATLWEIWQYCIAGGKWCCVRGYVIVGGREMVTPTGCRWEEMEMGMNGIVHIRTVTSLLLYNFVSLCIFLGVSVVHLQIPRTWWYTLRALCLERGRSFLFGVSATATPSKTNRFLSA